MSRDMQQLGNDEYQKNYMDFGECSDCNYKIPYISGTCHGCGDVTIPCPACMGTIKLQVTDYPKGYDKVKEALQR